jgi:hypothetical protein
MAVLGGILGVVVAVGLVFRDEKGKKNMNRKTLKDRWGTLLGGLRIRLVYLRKTDDSAQGNSGIPETYMPVEERYRSGTWVNVTEGLFFVLGLATFIFLMLALFSFTRPGTRLVSEDLNFQHLGFFTYTTKAPPGIYDSDTLQSGQPIFPKLTCNLDVGFNYTLLGEQVESAGGAYQLTAVLSDPLSGWQRSLALQPQTVFAGTAFDTQANLNLCQLTAMLESIEAQVDITGIVAGAEMHSVFDPALTFKYDRVHFYILRDDPESDSLTPIEPGFIREQHREANTLSLFGLQARVPLTRFISLAGFGLSVAGLFMLGSQLHRLSHRDSEAFIRMKYKPLLIDVQTGSHDTSSRSIDVSSIDDLAKLAEKHNATILHEAQADNHKYFVQGNGVLYRYSLRVGGPGISVDFPMASQDDMLSSNQPKPRKKRSGTEEDQP